MRKTFTILLSVGAIFLFSLLFARVIPVSATSGVWSNTGSLIYYNDGNVGIGTNTSTAKLDVSGSSSSTDNTTIDIANNPGRGWLFVNHAYANTGHGNYAMTIQQPDYAECVGCKGDLILRPGGIVSIPYVALGLGTTSVGDYRLAVNGKIKAREIVVTNTGWADYVFDPSYDLMSLSDLKNYVDENKHLPNVPSAEEVADSGISVGDMQTKQMEKIEELTLYIIQQDKRISDLEQKLDELTK